MLDVYMRRQYVVGMPNVSPKQLTKWLQVRADAAFLETIDRLRADNAPPLSRSDFVRKLVIEADRKRKPAK